MAIESSSGPIFVGAYYARAAYNSSKRNLKFHRARRRVCKCDLARFVRCGSMFKRRAPGRFVGRGECLRVRPVAASKRASRSAVARSYDRSTPSSAAIPQGQSVEGRGSTILLAFQVERRTWLRSGCTDPCSFVCRDHRDGFVDCHASG